MKSLLLALLPFIALALGRGYTAFADKRIAEYEEYIELLGRVRGRVGSFMTPIAEVICESECRVLSDIGFIGALREGATLSEAYRAAKQRSYASSTVKRIMTSFFQGFGHSYLDETVREIDSTAEELRSAVESERVEIERSVKLARSLLMLAAVGLIILLI